MRCTLFLLPFSSLSNYFLLTLFLFTLFLSFHLFTLSSLSFLFVCLSLSLCLPFLCSLFSFLSILPFCSSSHIFPFYLLFLHFFSRASSLRFFSYPILSFFSLCLSFFYPLFYFFFPAFFSRHFLSSFLSSVLFLFFLFYFYACLYSPSYSQISLL